MDDRDEKMVQVAARIVQLFGSGVGFVMIVHDVIDKPPMVADNFRDREGALSLVLSVADGYRGADTETVKTGRVYEFENATGAVRFKTREPDDPSPDPAA